VITGKNPPRGQLLRIAEMCPLIGYRPQTVYNSIYSGAGELAQLPYCRVGRSIRFAEMDRPRIEETCMKPRN
jgi:hypothetical protein